MSDISARIEGRAGRITLNRPKALNALTLPMVHDIDAALTHWAENPNVSLVIVDGAGDRAFCAGGDIRMLYDAARTGDLAAGYAFFSAEYALNARIARYPKPYVAIMDGIVMGGGVGLSAHGSVRIVTERTMLAMPETGIGLFPDVGATWLLSRTPARGMHLALTGARIGAGDALLAGLADRVVDSADLPAIVQALCGGDATEMHAFAKPPEAGAMAADLAWMDACYGHDTVEEIAASLADHVNPAAKTAAHDIAAKSPSSLKVTFRALREAAGMKNLEEALAQELVLAVGCLRSHDFVEGVRAAVVDKDRSPRWRPARLGDVKDAMVEEYFSKHSFFEKKDQKTFVR